MSLRPWRCGQCRRDGVSRGLQSLPAQNVGGVYGVHWVCPTCQAESLDVCPLGPLVPGPDACPNCGHPGPGAGPDTPCPACGLTRPAAVDFLTPGPPLPEPVAAARGLFERGLYRRGLALLNRALEADPSLRDAWALKGDFLEWLGQKGLVPRMYEEALARGAPPDLLLGYGEALHRAGRYPEAAAVIRRHLERHLERHPEGPGAARARGQLGLTVQMQGDSAAAEELFRQAVAGDPDTPAHHRNLAQLLIDQRRWSGAMGALEEGLKRAQTAEDRCRLHEGLAYVHAEEERAEAALEAIDQAVSLGCARPRTHYLRGRALALLGRLDEARGQILLVLEQEPDHADARSALALIEQAARDARAVSDGGAR